jgi:hypothetical protein
MPVFHTKTIEQILEPVAQQVNKLDLTQVIKKKNRYIICKTGAKISKLILNEDGEENENVMPDLSMPVLVVKKAADNLINV